MERLNENPESFFMRIDTSNDQSHSKLFVDMLRYLIKEAVFAGYIPKQHEFYDQGLLVLEIHKPGRSRVKKAKITQDVQKEVDRVEEYEKSLVEKSR